jgi:Xaa-Pro aminopeptidase
VLLQRAALVCTNKWTLTFIFTVLKPLSVFLFSEPGYYHEGHFGVRLENVLEVVKKQTKVKEESTLRTIEN